MERYAAISGDAGVAKFEIGETAIMIEFRDGRQYLYSYRKPGKNHVEQMKVLARTGKGLTTYINQHVRDNYDDKIK